MDHSRQFLCSCLIAAAALAASFAESSAAVVSLVRQSRALSASELAAGAPVDGVVHDFFITTQSDFLSVSAVTIDAPLYQHQWGSDHRQSTTALVDQDASVGVNSFIQMPGDTLVLGGGFSGGAESLWGDLSDDGAQQDFLFARLTTTGVGSFAGNLAVRTDFGFESLPYRFDLPALAGLDPFGNTQSIQIEYTPLPPTPPQPTLSPVIESPVIESPVIESPVIESPVIESPVIEPPVVVPEVPAIEIVPPTVELLPPQSTLPEEPTDPALPTVEKPQSGDASEVVFAVDHESISLIIDDGAPLGWIDSPIRTINFTGWLELQGEIRSIQLDGGYPGIELFGDLAVTDASGFGSSSMHDLQFRAFNVSTGISRGSLFFANSTLAASERSAPIPEPFSALLGAMAIAAAMGVPRCCRKTGATRPSRL